MTLSHTMCAVAMWCFVTCLAAMSAASAADADAPHLKRDVLLVLNKAEATVSVIDPETNETHATIAVGEGPHEAHIDPDGRIAVVGNYGQRTPGSSLSVIDLHTLSVVRTIDLGEYQRPHGIWFLPGGERIVVTAEAQRKLLIVDPWKGEVVAAINTDQEISHMVALSRDGSRAFVPNIRSGSVSVIDLNTRELIGIVETGEGAEGVWSHPTRDEVWVTNRAADTVSVLDANTLEILATLECPSFPIRAAITPDGTHALISCARSGDIAVFDTDTRELVRRIAMNEEPVNDDEMQRRLFRDTFGRSPVPIGILIRPDGREAFVANTNADVVSVIDLSTWRIARRLTAGREPDGLAWRGGE